MSFLFRLAALSAWNRRSTLALTIFSIALSTFMLLGVERVRTDLRASFGSAISGTDLIVGARTGSVQLLLFSVFHVGAPTSPWVSTLFGSPSSSGPSICAGWSSATSCRAPWVSRCRTPSNDGCRRPRRGR